MASFKGNGRDEASKRRAAENRRLRQGRPNLESLEQRRLLTGPWTPTSTDPYDVQHGPLANLGKDLITAYHDYVNYSISGSHVPFTSSESSRIILKGTAAAIDIRGSGDITLYSQQLAALGMQVSAVNARTGTVTGYVPLQDLPAIAAQAQTIGGSAIFKPITYFQGTANNQADAAEFADVARTTFGVNGAGQKVGVLSNSFNQALPNGAGYANSIASGNLPNNIQVLNDGVAGSDDEGRAMLENLYDMVPGASFAFSTAFRTDIPGEAGFADSVLALKSAGATTIIDDVGFASELYYQDSVASQSISTVVSQGATYFTSAGNSADGGYQSVFRGVNATVGTLGCRPLHELRPHRRYGHDPARHQYQWHHRRAGDAVRPAGPRRQ